MLFGDKQKGSQAIAHERKRFSTLTPKQLETRLRRIKTTNRNKLEAFIIVAQEYASMATDWRKKRYELLAKRAEDKLAGRLCPGHQLMLDFLEH